MRAATVFVIAKQHTFHLWTEIMKIRIEPFLRVRHLVGCAKEKGNRMSDECLKQTEPPVQKRESLITSHTLLQTYHTYNIKTEREGERERARKKMGKIR